MFDSGTVSIQNIQLAMWLGAKKIYLIGFEHFYSEKKVNFRSQRQHQLLLIIFIQNIEKKMKLLILQILS